MELILSPHKLWEAKPRVIQFIINMEESQNKLVRVQMPTTNNMFAAFATFMILKSNAFPRERPVWESKQVGEQLWSEWKNFFKPLQLALERKTAASSDKPEMLGTVDSAQRYHGILPDLFYRSHGQGENSQDILAQLDGQFLRQQPPTATRH